MRRLFLRSTFFIYRFFISPVLHIAFTGGCRFTPSCSQYAEEAFMKLSFLSALKATIFRLLKCHPWTPLQYDPVRGNLKKG